MHIAAANGYLRVVEFLLDQHVCTDVKDSDDWQPVHAAACWGHVSISLRNSYMCISPSSYSILFVCFALLMYNKLNGVQFPTELLFFKHTFYISEDFFLIEVNRPIYLYLNIYWIV